MKNFLLLLPFLAAGCATGPSLQSRMASYTGASEQTLVDNFGVPDKQISINGTQYLAYDKRHFEFDSGFDGFYGAPFDHYGPYFAGGFYNGPIGFAGPQSLQELSCETTFVLQHGKVVNFSLRGNDCT